MFNKSLFRFLENFRPSYEPFNISLRVFDDNDKSCNIKISYDEEFTMKKTIDWYPDNTGENNMFDPSILPGITDDIKKHIKGYILCEPNQTFYVIYMSKLNKLVSKVVYENRANMSMKSIFKIILNNSPIAFIDNNLDCILLQESSMDIPICIRQNILKLSIIFNDIEKLIKLDIIKQEVFQLLEYLQEDIKYIYDGINLMDKRVKNYNEIVKSISDIFDEIKYKIERNDSINNIEYIKNHTLNLLDGLDKIVVELDEEQ